jgi:DNA invertase Pin-like site-specific DNA recombinase
MQDLIKYGNVLIKNRQLSKEKVKIIKDYLKSGSYDETGYMNGVSGSMIWRHIHNIIDQGKQFDNTYVN